jgi:hypothetical protein
MFSTALQLGQFARMGIGAASAGSHILPRGLIGANRLIRQTRSVFHEVHVFNWLRKKTHTPTPEERTVVEVNDEWIRARGPDGREDSIQWADLRRVRIVTRDCGPFLEDVYFHLEGQDNAFFIPQSAQCTTDLAGRFARLPGFDIDAFVRAMSCSSNACFDCWRRVDKGPGDGNATGR